MTHQPANTAAMACAKEISETRPPSMSMYLTPGQCSDAWCEQLAAIISRRFPQPSREVLERAVRVLEKARTRCEEIKERDELDVTLISLRGLLDGAKKVGFSAQEADSMCGEDLASFGMVRTPQEWPVRKERVESWCGPVTDSPAPRQEGPSDGEMLDWLEAHCNPLYFDDSEEHCAHVKFQALVINTERGTKCPRSLRSAIRRAMSAAHQKGEGKA